MDATNSNEMIAPILSFIWSSGSAMMSVKFFHQNYNNSVLFWSRPSWNQWKIMVKIGQHLFCPILGLSLGRSRKLAPWYLPDPFPQVFHQNFEVLGSASPLNFTINVFKFRETFFVRPFSRKRNSWPYFFFLENTRISLQLMAKLYEEAS